MSEHSELFECYGAPLIMQHHGEQDAVVLKTRLGEDIECNTASLGPVSFTNETVTTDAGNITDRVARRTITLDVVPPLDAIAEIDDEVWSIEEISSSGALTRVALIRIMASSYGNKQIA